MDGGVVGASDDLLIVGASHGIVAFGLEHKLTSFRGTDARAVDTELIERTNIPAGSAVLFVKKDVNTALIAAVFASCATNAGAVFAG